MNQIIIPSSQSIAPNIRRITYRDLRASTTEGTQLNYLRSVLQQYRGQNIDVSYKYYELDDFGVPVEFEDITNVDVPVNNFSSWWYGWSQFFFPDSGNFIFDLKYNSPTSPASLQTQLIIGSQNKVGNTNYLQYFLDGSSHCVFTPIMNWAIDKTNSSKGKSTIKRYKTMQNKLNIYLDKYKNGVPAPSSTNNDLQEICNELGIAIEIDIPSTMLNKKTNYIKVEPVKKTLRTFKFINTRLNHIEINNVVDKDSYIQVSQQFLTDLVEEYIDKGEFIMYKGDTKKPYQVHLLDRTYQITEDEGYQKELRDFIKKNKLSNYKIEHYSNLELSQFLLNNLNKNGNILLDRPFANTDNEYYFNQYLQNPEDDEDCPTEVINYINNNYKNLNHIDMKKSYTRGSDCSYYQGYLGKITDFRQTDKIEGLGIYMIHNIMNIPPLLQKLKVLHEYNCYTSPELKFYKSLGITFDIVLGCWGTRTDINFGDNWNEGMFKKEIIRKNKPTSHYCRWYGCNHKLTEYNRYNFYCKDLEFAKLNNIRTDCEIRFNQYKKTGLVEYKKEKTYHSTQISIFIHSYCTISMIEQLLKFKDINQIIAVQVDGIFYKGDVEIGKLFAVDKKGNLSSVRGDEYIPDCENRPEDYSILQNTRPRKHRKLEVHTGPGGAGKTYTNLIDKGLVAPLYVGHSWKLSRSKQKEFGIDCCCHYHIAETTDPDVYNKYIKYYNTLIIDEISTLSNENKKTILKRFKDHKIIFCGDIGYQLPCVEGTEFQIDKIKQIKHDIPKDINKRRCKCSKLSKILKHLRTEIDKGNNQLTENLLDFYNMKILDKDSIDYTIDDLIITFTHKVKDEYTDKYKNLNKYRITENTNHYFRNEIVSGKLPDGAKGKLQHAFTIHSIQGETAKNTLFIDMEKMKCLRMFYTALSRAEYLNQIVLIK
jgi:hypothetical protein